MTDARDEIVDCLKAEIERLGAQNKRLMSRGIEDMHQEIKRLEALWAQEQKRAERAEGELFAANYDIVNVLEPKIAALMKMYDCGVGSDNLHKFWEARRQVTALLEGSDEENTTDEETQRRVQEKGVDVRGVRASPRGSPRLDKK